MIKSAKAFEKLIKDEDEYKAFDRYLITESWHLLCLFAILIYAAIWFVYKQDSYQDPKYTVYEDDGKSIKAYDSDPDFQWITSIACLAFACSGFRAIFSLLFIKPIERPVAYCVIVINLLALFTHVSYYMSNFPVMDSCFGRKTHVLRLAEWSSVVVLLMCLLNSLDCPSKREYHASTLIQLISVFTGYVSGFSCHMNWGGDDIEPSDGHWKHRGVSHPNESWFTSKAFMNSSRSFKICLLLLSISCLLFLDCFRFVRLRYIRSQRLKLPVLSNILHVSIALVFSWVIVVMVYFLGCFNYEWFDTRVELRAYATVDFLAKFVLANLLGDAHVHVQQLEKRAQALIQLKDQSHNLQQEFLRYVFHEVRVPLNTIRLGLDSLTLKNNAAMSNSSSSSGSISSYHRRGRKNSDAGDNTVEEGEEEEEGRYSDSEHSYNGGLNENTLLAMSCMDQAATTMSDTLNDVLSYHRIREGEMQLDVSSFSIQDDVFMKLTQVFHANFSDNDLTLVTNIDPRLPRDMIGDSPKIKQVLNNMLSNAGKNCHQRSDVLLSAEVSAIDFQIPLPGALLDASQDRFIVHVKFSVQDNGIGISEENQEHLFQGISELISRQASQSSFSNPLSQTPEKSTSFVGGLGLCISKHMVELMGGEIGVKSSLGQGSTFYFIIPLLIDFLEAESMTKRIRESEELNKKELVFEEYAKDDNDNFVDSKGKIGEEGRRNKKSKKE